MASSDKKYTSTLPTLYQYPNWELPAETVIKTHSLLALSGCEEILQEKQASIPESVGLARPDARCVLLNERFYDLLMKEHYRLNECHLVEDSETHEDEEEEDFRRQLECMRMELDKQPCEQRNLELKNKSMKIFPDLKQLKHGDIIQFRNERLQFSYYVYQARKGTFDQLLNQFKLHVTKVLEGNGSPIKNLQSLPTNDYEWILIPSIEPDGYGIPSVFSDAPLHHFAHLSPGVMYRWIYVNLIDSSMPIYDYIQRDIELKKNCPTYRTLVSEAGVTDSLITDEDGEELIIEDLETFPISYVCLYAEVISKLNIEWRKIDSNNYCNRNSAMYLLAKWIRQLQ